MPTTIGVTRRDQCGVRRFSRSQKQHHCDSLRRVGHFEYPKPGKNLSHDHPAQARSAASRSAEGYALEAADSARGTAGGGSSTSRNEYQRDADCACRRGVGSAVPVPTSGDLATARGFVAPYKRHRRLPHAWGNRRMSIARLSVTSTLPCVSPSISSLASCESAFLRPFSKKGTCVPG